MAIQLQYELANETPEDATCITPCPFKSKLIDLMVGSMKCLTCEHFIRDDEENKVLYCGYSN